MGYLNVDMKKLKKVFSGNTNEEYLKRQGTLSATENSCIIEVLPLKPIQKTEIKVINKPINGAIINNEIDEGKGQIIEDTNSNTNDGFKDSHRDMGVPSKEYPSDKENDRKYERDNENKYDVRDLKQVSHGKEFYNQEFRGNNEDIDRRYVGERIKRIDTVVNALSHSDNTSKTGVVCGDRSEKPNIPLTEWISKMGGEVLLSEALKYYSIIEIRKEVDDYNIMRYYSRKHKEDCLCT